MEAIARLNNKFVQKIKVPRNLKFHVQDICDIASKIKVLLYHTSKIKLYTHPNQQLVFSWL